MNPVTNTQGGRPLQLLKVGPAVLIALLALSPACARQTTAPDTSGGPETRMGRTCHMDQAEDESDPHPKLHDAQVPPSKDNCDVDRIANDQERRKMETYLAEHVRKEDIVRSLKLPSGEMVDCVDIYKQPAMRRPGMEKHELQLRPSGDPEDRRDGDQVEALGEEDPALKNKKGDPQLLKQEYMAAKEQCPEKSVPMRRLTMDILKNFKTLEEFRRKNPPHLVDGPTNLHQYAHAYRNGDNWGAQSILNVWGPYTERADEFSLSQIWVVRGSGDNRETVEAGWQKYRDLYGDYRPRLFIYFTPDNYGDGGCYNLTCDAFVQVNNSIYIGGGFTNISQHPHPSTAWEFKLRWQKDGTTGHWWLKYGDTWVGYYPRSLFDSNGLSDKAAKVDFGGEIIDRQPGGRHTKTDMGSGHFPSDGFGYAAYQRQIRYITTNNVWGTYPSLSESRSDSDCYDISVSSSTGSWERYFYFGGPGYNNHCQ
jgi:hypothetical protein